MRMPEALQARSVQVRFGGQVVLRDLSFSLESGQKTLLTGPSGSGKSTVLRCFLGFVVPDAGSVYIDDTPLTAETVWRLRQRLAYVGQEPDLGTGTAAQAVERPFHYRANAARRRNLERLPELMDRFYLPKELLGKDVSALSGGEKQRVALVSAILLDRPIFLLDEVTSALDRVSRQAVADYFHSRPDATVLAVAHDTEALSPFGRVIELPGRLHLRDTP